MLRSVSTLSSKLPQVLAAYVQSPADRAPLYQPEILDMESFRLPALEQMPAPAFPFLLPLIVGHNLVQRANHVFHIPRRHGMEHGQADQSLIGVFCNRIAWLSTETLAVVRMLMDRNIVNIYADLLREQRLKYLSSPRRKQFQFQPDRIQVPRRNHAIAHRGDDNSPQIPECLGILRRNFAPACQVHCQFLQL